MALSSAGPFRRTGNRSLTGEGRRTVTGVAEAGQVDALLRARRSVRSFGPGTPPREVVETALDGAVWVPNHRRTEPWRFVVAGGGVLRRLAERAGELKLRPGAGPELVAVAERTMQELRSAAYAVAVLQKEAADPEIREEDYASCVLAIHQAVLALWTRGVAARWSSGTVTRDATVRTLLGARPDERIALLCYVGYPGPVPARPAPSPASSRTTWME